MSKLTAKQQRFVEEYLVDLNATQAAIRAGYSPKTAKPQASRMLTNVNLQKAIQELKSERSERTLSTADRVVVEFEKIAYFDIRKVLTDQGQILQPEHWDDDTAAALTLEVVRSQKKSADGKSVQSEYTQRIKVRDKLSALVSLGRHLGIFDDKEEPPEGVSVVISPSDKLVGYLDVIAKRLGTTGESS